MLQDTKKLCGCAVRASDGDMGRISDIIFDENTWALRYLVVDTSALPQGGKALLAPEAFEANALAMTKPLRANVRLEQVESCPPFEAYPPLSRLDEEQCYHHYGWPPYWKDSASPEEAAISAMIGPAQMQETSSGRLDLRSVNSCVGFRVLAIDGDIGKVRSFTVDTRKWKLAEVVVDSGHWYARKRILILPESITQIRRDESTISVALSMEDIRNTGPDRVAQAGIFKA